MDRVFIFSFQAKDEQLGMCIETNNTDEMMSTEGKCEGWGDVLRNYRQISA